MTESKFSENRCFISSWLSLRITKNNRPVTDVLVMNARTFQKLLGEAISVMDFMAFLIRQPGTLGEECPVPCHNYFLSVCFSLELISHWSLFLGDLHGIMDALAQEISHWVALGEFIYLMALPGIRTIHLFSSPIA